MSSDHARAHSSTGDNQYTPGTDSRFPISQRRLRAIEWAVLFHVGVFLVAVTWIFGGGVEAWRPAFAWWGSLGLVITAAALKNHGERREDRLKPLVWLIPLAGFNALVVTGTFIPAMREIRSGTEIFFLPLPINAALPASARPALGLHALWLFDAIWISCFNIALVIRQRRAIRGLLILLAFNTLALAVFGTVQKLAHAKGLFFDAVPSPQVFFFSSFIYHNHWGSFAVLSLAAALGLIWHYSRRIRSRDFLHSPTPLGLVLLFFIAASVPLSTSRSCTVLVSLLFLFAFLHWFSRLLQRRRQQRESLTLPLGAAILALAVGGGGVWYVAQESIHTRVGDTMTQIKDLQQRGSSGARGVLYRDTWHMAQSRPWFGWGMASYPHVFIAYNTQESKDRLPVFYHDAHSDWLQSLAEHGFVGTTLLGLCGIVPLLGVRRHHLSGALPVYLLGGCALILLYAWVEFPFGNVAVVLTWWLCFFSAVHYARLQEREASAPNRSGAAA